MWKLILVSYIAPWLMLASCMDTVNDTDALVNSTDPNKDMYVIHAMVYQVGILTNKTDNETANSSATTGQQEALTFYHNNGSQVDLSKIPEPLLTNVKAQSIVGVAPVTGSEQITPNQLPWNTLSQLSNTGKAVPPLHPIQESLGSQTSIKSVRDVHSDYVDNDDSTFDTLYNRMFKRETAGGGTPVAISKSSAVIPSAAGVQSIAIPPLLTLNNNLSEIPVPIPNTSIVHYSKINTLVTKP